MTLDVDASSPHCYLCASRVSLADFRAKFGVEFLKIRCHMACGVAIFRHATLLAGDIVGVTPKGTRRDRRVRRGAPVWGMNRDREVLLIEIERDLEPSGEFVALTAV